MKRIIKSLWISIIFVCIYWSFNALLLFKDMVGFNSFDLAYSYIIDSNHWFILFVFEIIASLRYPMTGIGYFLNRVNPVFLILIFSSVVLLMDTPLYKKILFTIMRLILSYSIIILGVIFALNLQSMNLGILLLKVCASLGLALCSLNIGGLVKAGYDILCDLIEVEGSFIYNVFERGG